VGGIDLNLWLGWLAPAADLVRAKRAEVESGNALLQLEKTASTAISASLDYYRAMRDAMSEAAFFTVAALYCTPATQLVQSIECLKRRPTPYWTGVFCRAEPADGHFYRRLAVGEFYIDAQVTELDICFLPMNHALCRCGMTYASVL
jgi:uncharacterized protein DUF3141